MATLLDHGRTHSCGALRPGDMGQTVVLFGWVNRRRDHGGRIFIDLRDREGLTQVVFGPDINTNAHGEADALRSEYCIGVRGTVVQRGENTNENMATGAIEVEVSALEVFSPSQTPPFSVADDDRLDTHENLRLKHRYLDLRRPSQQSNFLARGRINHITRNTMAAMGFVELETPFMVKYTPGGARNFLVPSRLSPGHFYALAESPQIYKQLFMVAGFDRYFQITRCFRDEDLRNDRQPEFTQIDVEMSFATPEHVYATMETLMADIWREVVGVKLETPFPKMTWDQAMARYGSDKPDTRFGLELQDVGDLTGSTGFRVFDDAECVKAICVEPQHAKALTRSQLDKLTEFVKKRENGGAKGLAWARVQNGGTWQAPFAKLMTADSMQAISNRCQANEGALLLFIADVWEVVHTTLNALRMRLRDQLELVAHDPKQWNFLWVTEFPLFERAENAWTSTHHPFTAPRDQDVELLDTDPGKVKAQAYDLVLNGNEIGGGSIRIHQAHVQAKIFEVLGLGDEEIQAKFGFLLEAFRYGPPPHGGIAMGMDRLAMLACDATSLRDVIAFPKTQRGQGLDDRLPHPRRRSSTGRAVLAPSTASRRRRSRLARPRVERCKQGGPVDRGGNRRGDVCAGQPRVRHLVAVAGRLGSLPGGGNFRQPSTSFFSRLAHGRCHRVVGVWLACRTSDAVCGVPVMVGCVRHVAVRPVARAAVGVACVAGRQTRAPLQS